MRGSQVRILYGPQNGNPGAKASGFLHFVGPYRIRKPEQAEPAGEAVRRGRHRDECRGSESRDRVLCGPPIEPCSNFSSILSLMEHFPRNNPNNIGPINDLAGLGNAKVPTSSDKVYRSVTGEEVLSDLFASGVVRNRAAATGYPSHRGEQVYWTQGEDGKSHGLNDGYHLIEAPHRIANERAVRADEVTGIYGINEDGEAENRLEALRTKLGIKKGESL